MEGKRIELGKLVYWNGGSGSGDKVVADRGRLRLLSSLLAMFLAGGLAGAFGFKYLGFVAIVPLALVLLSMAVLPLIDDWRAAPL